MLGSVPPCLLHPEWLHLMLSHGSTQTWPLIHPLSLSTWLLFIHSLSMLLRNAWKVRVLWSHLPSSITQSFLPGILWFLPVVLLGKKVHLCCSRIKNLFSLPLSFPYLAVHILFPSPGYQTLNRMKQMTSFHFFRSLSLASPFLQVIVSGLKSLFTNKRFRLWEKIPKGFLVLVFFFFSAGSTPLQMSHEESALIAPWLNRGKGMGEGEGKSWGEK